VKVVPYNDAVLHAVEEPTPRNEVTAIASELSARLIDFYEISPLKCIVYLQQLIRVYRTSPESFQLALQVLSGSGEEKKSYSELAKKAGTSRQYQHKQRQRELAKLSKQFPKVAEILRKSLWTNRNG
jgi:hypothetical protein